jgi:hypothetical protein
MTHPPAVPCPNCGAPSARYCPACGQDNARPRLEAREVLLDAFHNLVGWDSALARTLRGLAVDPGGLAADYVAGRRRRFVQPARFCLLALALWFLFARSLGFDPMELAGFKFEPGEGTGEEAARILRVREFLARNFEVLLYLSLPLRAALLRWFFPRSGRNLAECVVLVLYLAGFGYLLGFVASPILVVDERAGLLVQNLASLTWSVRAARTFFGAGWWAAGWRSLVAAVVHVLGTALLALLLGFAYWWWTS